MKGWDEGMKDAEYKVRLLGRDRMSRQVRGRAGEGKQVSSTVVWDWRI